MGTSERQWFARVTATSPVERSPSYFLSLSLGEWPRLPSTARIKRYTCSLQACSLCFYGWGLIDLPLRASNEGLLRPRVARAQKDLQAPSSPLFCEQEGHLAAPCPAGGLFQHPVRDCSSECACGGQSTEPCTEAPPPFLLERPSGKVLILCGIPWRRVDRFDC